MLKRCCLNSNYLGPKLYIHIRALQDKGFSLLGQRTLNAVRIINTCSAWFSLLLIIIVMFILIVISNVWIICQHDCKCVCVYVRDSVSNSGISGCVLSAKIVLFVFHQLMISCVYAFFLSPHSLSWCSCRFCFYFVWLHSHPSKSFQKLKHYQ